MTNPANYQNQYNVVGSYTGSPESIKNPPNFEQTSRFLSSNEILIPQGACSGTSCNIKAAAGMFETLKGGGRKKNKSLKYMYGGNRLQTFSQDGSYSTSVGTKGAGYPHAGTYDTRDLTNSKIGGRKKNGGRKYTTKRKMRRTKRKKLRSSRKGFRGGGCSGFKVGSVNITSDESMLANPPPVLLYK